MSVAFCPFSKSPFKLYNRIEFPGTFSTAADKFSRYQAAQILHSYPNASHISAKIPDLLLQIVSPVCLDWISLAFTHHFRYVINLTQQYSPCAIPQRQ